MIFDICDNNVANVAKFNDPCFYLLFFVSEIHYFSALLD